MVPRKYIPEGAGIPPPGSVTSLLQPPPMPAPPETKCSGEEGRTHRRAEKREKGQEGMDEGSGDGGAAKG